MVLVILTLDFMDERLLFYAPLESINAQGARKKGPCGSEGLYCCSWECCTENNGYLMHEYWMSKA